MDRFTQFPAIQGQTTTGDSGLACMRRTWPSDTAALPLEVLAHAWAALLQAYTTEEAPVFLLNGRPVKVNAAARSIQPATLDPIEFSAEHTAVHVDDESERVSSGQQMGDLKSRLSPSELCTLTWHFDRNTQTSTLQATAGMDSQYIQQLGYQLEHMVRDRAALSDMALEWPSPVDQSPPTDMRLSIANPSPKNLPGPQLLHELALSNTTTEHDAIEFMTADGTVRHLSYRALDQASTRLAATIEAAATARAGERRKLVVPVLLPQSLELYITQLAILKAGGAFCPLTIDAPSDRVEFILQDVAASVVVTQNALATRIPEDSSVAVITVDELERHLDNHEHDDTETTTPEHAYTISPTDLAYVMYTSGSTGRPKGVGISHLAATQSLLAHNDLIPHFARFLQFASPTFDVSVFEIFFPLFRGATLVGCDREQMLLDISHVLTTMRVDAAELTPTVAGELLRTRAAAPSLRVLLTIGEMLTRHVVDEFASSPSGTDGILHGMYGPTEAAIHCTAATQFRSDDRVNLIGRAFSTVSAFIMSMNSEDEKGASARKLEPLPLGQIGELVVGGPQLADGYINRPEENAKAFIESPVYGRLYRTGDKARMLPSGDIECFGRISSGQVKLRGQRIELGEIEHAICQAPGARSAVAIVSNGSLAAFVLVTGTETTERTLRDVCRQWLPRFMVPGEFILVDQFPQLPSGKIDRKLLEAEFKRHRSNAQAAEEYQFRDETEETIASCVAGVMGRQLSSAESLSAAGLDSLSAIRLASHLLDVGVRLDVARLLEADSVSGIWTLVKEAETTSPDEDSRAGLQLIQQLVADAGTARVEALGLSSKVEAIDICSHIQQAMIMETTRHEKAYCNWVELELLSEAKISTVQAAISKLLERTPILRSGFVEIGLKDQSYARITYQATQLDIVQECRNFEYDVPLLTGNDLLHPLKFQFKEAEGGSRLLVHLHHALYDGWSWQLILKDFAHLLSGEEIEPRPEYSVVSEFFTEYRLGQSHTDSLTFWRDKLQGLPVAPFPNFNGSSEIPTGTRETSRDMQISTQRLAEISQNLRISRQTIFQAAYCYLLSTYVGSEDVTFGTVFSGRTLPVKGIENVLGPCIRTLPTRMALDKMQNAADLLLAIQNMNHRCLEHGSVSLQDIKKTSEIDPQSSLFDTAFVWQETMWSGKEYQDIFKEVNQAEFLEFALLLEIEPRESHIHAKITFQQSILSQQQAEILLEQIDAVVAIFLDDSSLAIGEIGHRLPQTALSIVEVGDRMDEEVSRILSTDAHVEPSLPAVQFLRSLGSEDSSIDTITYEQLEAQSNSFAEHLHQHGVKEDDLIALVLNHSVQSYIALLAVAKLGAGLVSLPWQNAFDHFGSRLSALDVGFFVTDSPNPDFSVPESTQGILVLEGIELSDVKPRQIHNSFRLLCIDPSTKEYVTFSSKNLSSCINAFEASDSLVHGSRLLCTQNASSPLPLIATFLTWSAGATLCATPNQLIASDPQKVISAMDITHLYTTPVLASRLDSSSLLTVKDLHLFGEPLTAKAHLKWPGKKVSAGIFNSTTTSILLSIYSTDKNFDTGYNCPIFAGYCTDPVEVDTATPRIVLGRPTKNTSVLVIANRTDAQILPRGAVGLLCFGGNQLGTSSSGKGIEDTQCGRLYRTQDLGRILPDGSVEILGQPATFSRINHTVLSSKHVRDCATLIMDLSESHQQQLVTVWVPSTAANSDEDLEEISQEIWRDLLSKLRSSELPSYVIPVPEISMTPDFFTDHASVSKLVRDLGFEDLQKYTALRGENDNGEILSETEKLIVTAISKVLDLDESIVGRHTSFYKLGLDSLSAIAFSRQLEGSGIGRLPVSTILRHSSVAQLADVTPTTVQMKTTEQTKGVERASSMFDKDFVSEVKTEVGSEVSSVQGVYPCTPLQEAMLAAESGSGAAYFNHLLLRVQVETDTMKEAWKQMVQRHEVLRTCFRQTNQRRFAYAQVVLDTAILPWTVIQTEPGRFDLEVEARKSDFEARSPVDGKLPYALTVFEDPVSESRHLLLSIHHALYDGEGIAQLLGEVQNLLAGEGLAGVTPFHHFIEYMVSVDAEASDQFWDRYLSGVSPTLLSTGQKRLTRDMSDLQASQQINGQMIQSLQAFKDLCKDLSVTPLNVFHAAWARLLALQSGSSDVCFGNVFSCRTVPLKGADKIVGPCFNTLPMRVKLSKSSTNKDVMKLSQRHNSDILPHQLSALRHIQKRALSGTSRLFDTLVIFQSKSTSLDPHYWEILKDEGNMGFPLICEVIPDEENDLLQVCLHFQESHASREEAEIIAKDLIALVEQMTQYPSAHVWDERVMSADLSHLFEKETSIAQINETGTKPSSSRAWSEEEQTLCAMICEFAGVEVKAVTLGTTIFQLGLDSINAVQISGKLRKMGYTVSAGDILEAASVEKIATLLSKGNSQTEEPVYDFSAFEHKHIQSVCKQLGVSLNTVQSLRPCTPVQCGMLALFSNTQGNMYYNKMALNSSTPLDKARLREAWTKTMARHEMLRTGFVQLHDHAHPFAMITYRAGIDLPWQETQNSLSASQEQAVLQNLHRPPWKILIDQCGSVTTVHFSALHALYDAQSLQSIFADVLAAYDGKPFAELAPLSDTLGPILIASEKQSEHSQEFWQGLAADFKSVKFPDLHPTRITEKFLVIRSARCSRPLPELESACRDAGVTLQAAGQAAWGRLLAAITGEQNVTFGTVLSGRNLSHTAQDAVFPCLVTVPSLIDTNCTNRELLKLTLKRNASLTKHQFTPLGKIQKWLGSDEPLFDTLFVYQKFAKQTATTSINWEVVDEETKIDYPVSIELVPNTNQLEIRISCRSDLVPAEQADLMLSQFDKILEHTIFSPDAFASDYLPLGDQLLSVTPAKEVKIPSQVSLLHQFVEESARECPERPAFEFAFGPNADSLQKKCWSYKEFNEDGNRVAHFLQGKGVVPGMIIGVCFDKCPEASLAILGILKAGCAYLAIDPSAPISRKQFILEDSSTAILLCNQSRMPELEELADVEVHALDEPGKFQQYTGETPSLAREISPEDTCYCLYTSGTTGTPKGCEITHDNAVQAMLAFQRLFSPHWDETSRWLQFASFHFDVSVLEQYWSWSVGICVTSCPRDLLFEDLPGTIQKLGITHIDLTPSLARLVHPEDVPSLCRGVFITGGEQLKQEILDAWGQHGVIYNGYGPTEVTIGCTMLPRMRANDKPSNIGPQFDNVGSYVFQPGTCVPVLRGGIGELCVSGPLVGKGYLNRAELTKERFQTLPDNGDRVYRTGDLVRILHDGSFQFLGRIDDQVKLRGQRLEIGEINEVIKQATPELNDVATLVVKHPKQSKDQLVTFITTTDVVKKSRDVEVRYLEEDRNILSAIKAACHSRLPGYMVPTHIIPMTKFPLSANNKAEMKVLKSMYQELSLENLQKLSSMAVEQSANTEHEKRIISVLADFTDSPAESISPWSSIFEVGLDSISVISFARSLRESGFPHAQASIIMKHPTITGMSKAFEQPTVVSTSQENLQMSAKYGIEAFAHKHAYSVIESIGANEGDVERIAPCTPLQEGIIYHFMSSPEPLYCSSFTFSLHEKVDLNALRDAWRQAHDRIQMLRARFVPTPDGYAQVVLKKDELQWFEEKATSSVSAEKLRQERFKGWTSRLEGLSGQLWEIGLIRSSEESIMCLNIFHALYDGNSLELLLDLVARIYFSQQRFSQDPPQFLDVLHLGPLCKSPAEEIFWKQHLKNGQSRPLPKLNEGDGQHTSLVQKFKITTTEPLDHLRKSLNVTEQAILHACWLLTLHQQYAFIPPIGMIASGRTSDTADLSNVIGPLFNTIPSNVQLHGLQSWSEVARKCHDYQVSSMPFQHTALRRIMKWLGKSPDESLFDTLFVFQRDGPSSENSSKSLWAPLNSDASHEYPLAFEIVRHGDESLELTLAVKENYVSVDMAEQLLSNYQRILTEFAQNPDHELPYINGSAEDRNAQKLESASLLNHVNGTNTSAESSFEWSDQATTIREIIAALAEVDVQSIDENTSIFEVGLDSIDAIKLSSRLAKSGIKLTVSVIMRYRTVKGMVSQLDEAIPGQEAKSLSVLHRMEDTLTKFLQREGLMPNTACRVLPATPIQEAMIAEMTASDYHHYYNHDILQIESHVDIMQLQNAWATVVKRHPILRTSFVEVWDPQISTSYAQVIHDESALDFRVVPLNGEPVESVVELQRKRATTELAGHPLLSLTVALDGDARYLILSISHALYDGWSINLLHGDVLRSYTGKDCARPSSDAILEQILTSSGDRALRFWKATLSNCVPVSFPRQKYSEAGSDVVHRAERALSVPFSKAELFCKRHGITMQALLVSCWAVVLSTYVEALDVVFGLVLSGRNAADTEEIMFPTMNTVAMRVILHGSRIELIKYVQETLLEISEYQHFPLRRARPDAQSRNLFDTLFIYQKRPSVAEADTLQLYQSTGGSSGVEYPVCAEVEGDGANLIARVACRGDVLGDQDTEVLLDRMTDALLFIIDEPDSATIQFAGDAMNVLGLPVQQKQSENAADSPQPGQLPSGHREWTTTELKIRSVLSTVSGMPEDSIGKEANIFELGLDSISAIKVVALLKKQSVKLVVSDMLKAGTIEKMAATVNQNQATISQNEITKALNESINEVDLNLLLAQYRIDPQGVGTAMQVTAGQSYFLSMHSLNPDVFYAKFYYLASSNFNLGALNSAWSKLISETPILRTAFLATGLSPLPFIQIVLKSAPNVPIWHDNLSHAISIEHSCGSPPVALHVSQTSRGVALMLHIHHALYDAVSLPLMVDRLAQLCSATGPTAQREHDLSHLIAFQHIHSPVSDRRQFWQKYLGQAQPSDAEINTAAEFGAIRHDYQPGLVSDMSRLERAAKRQGLSIQSIFLALYARVHCHVLVADRVDEPSAAKQLVVGLYLANRSFGMDGLSELMAPTVNIVPLRLDDKMSSDSQTLFAVARKIQEDINEISSVEHAGVSLTEIAEWTGVRISTCINFLRLPDFNDSKVDDASDAVIFRSIPAEELDAIYSSGSSDCSAQFNGDRVASDSGQATEPNASLAALKEVFLPTIDIEAAIRDDRLDFGVFAPDARLDRHRASKLIERMKHEMTSLIKACEVS